MANRPRYTNKQIEDALRKGAGLRTAAANILGCSPSTITNYLDRSEELNAVLAEIKNQHLDLAESKLLTAIKSGNMTAIIFFLKTIGRHRGYSERIEMSGPDGKPVQAAMGVIVLPAVEKDGT